MSQEQPKWWEERHESAWQRIKDALRRDWEQTKADLTRTHGHDLHQSALDTVKQALGTEPLPPFPSQATPHPVEDHWFRVVHAVRYGYGAGIEYVQYMAWEQAEEDLRKEWEEMKDSPDWEVVQREVRLGWDRGRAERG